MPIKERPICRFCGSDDLESLSVAERMLGIGDQHSYFHCNSCGSLQIAQPPQDLANYYPADYYSFNTLVPSSPFKSFLKKVRMSLFLKGVDSLAPIYGYWLKRLNLNFNDKVADIGCGNGQLIYEMNAGGFRDLKGYDPFIEKGRILGDGCELIKGEFSESKGTFDLIMMHHSFEHMEDPEEVLKLCYDRLGSDGQLLIRTPVADAEVFQNEKEYWVQLDSPRHLIIPSVKGMEIAAKKCGLKLKEVLFDSDDFQFTGTELYKRGKALSQENLKGGFTEAELSAYKKRALQLNKEGKGDQACFFFIKTA